MYLSLDPPGKLRMKGRWLLMACTLVFASCAKVKQTVPRPAVLRSLPPFQDEGGFYSEGDSRIPPPVSSATASVFRVALPDRTAQQKISIANIAGIYWSTYANLAGNAAFTVVAQAQIDECRSRQVNLFDDPPCTISRAVDEGTAFLAGDGRTLWTALHVVKDGLGFAEASDVIGQPGSEKVALFVFNKRGETVIDPYRDVVTIRSLGASATQYTADEDGSTLDGRDFASFTLPASIGTPLSTALARPARGEPVYLLGYPTCTGCSENADKPNKDYSTRAPGPDSDGASLRVTFGEVADLNYLDAVFAENANTISPRLLITTNDAIDGNSGGPALNAQGEVLGLASFVKDRIILGKRRRVMVFTIPRW
jgi:hypothetical protein